ncbi:MAG: EAL domain-containing protein [Arenimonas sp.]
MSKSVATILIVEDDIRGRKLLESLLRLEGYEAVSVGSGEEALAKVAESAPDLILLDVMLPGIDGYQVVSMLKANPDTSNIPVIMLTARISQKAKLAGLNAGAEEFLTKPVDRTELWLRVRNLLRLKEFGNFLKNHHVILEQQVQSRTSELQRFRSAMDSTADAIFLVNRSSMCVAEANATACAMMGCSQERLRELGPIQFEGGTIAELETLYDRVISGEGGADDAEKQMRRCDGSQFQAEVHRHAQQSGADWIIVSVVRDITERIQARERVHQLAHFDELTGLPNRTFFYKSLENSLSLASDGGWRVAVMFIDLDQFKNVNDSLGHAFGDELLVEISARLLGCVRLRDTVGRLGGDEFAVILVMRDGRNGAEILAAKIHDALRRPFEIKGHEVSITASIGITIYPDDASDLETLLKYADTAMYRDKLAGRDTSRFFTAQMNADVSARLDLEHALRKAVDNGEFVLHYQPKVLIGTGQVVGVEALLRWQRPEHGLVPPNEFIPILEDSGLIIPVGTWVLATACAQISHWRQAGIGLVQIAINVSGRQFTDGDLVADVVKALADSGVAPDLLELELTESSLMADTERTIASLQQLKQLGVRTSIDDFGTGYSSLAYLRRFPIDKLKIDVAFVRGITSNADDAALAVAIVRMAHSLKLEVIAEGVETAEQLAFLSRHGCNQMQGYYFSRPLPGEGIEQLLREGRCMPPAAHTGASPLVMPGAAAQVAEPVLPAQASGPTSPAISS